MSSTCSIFRSISNCIYGKSIWKRFPQLRYVWFNFESLKMKSQNSNCMWNEVIFVQVCDFAQMCSVLPPTTIVQLLDKAAGLLFWLKISLASLKQNMEAKKSWDPDSNHLVFWGFHNGHVFFSSMWAVLNHWNLYIYTLILLICQSWMWQVFQELDRLSDLLKVHKAPAAQWQK